LHANPPSQEGGHSLLQLWEAGTRVEDGGGG
jgi:hypothetical protein